jgi:hypothetical protein
MNHLIKIFSLFLGLFLITDQAWANCTVNGREIPCDQFWSEYGWIFTIIGVIFIPLLIAFLCFWVWMLVDCLKSDREDKLIWILVIIFTNIIGAILYFFMARGKAVKV